MPTYKRQDIENKIKKTLEGIENNKNNISGLIPAGQKRQDNYLQQQLKKQKYILNQMKNNNQVSIPNKIITID